MEFEWKPLSHSDWKSVPYVEGRLATEADVIEGRAVFYVNGYGRIVEACGLPALARLVVDGESSEVVVIQLEGHPEEDVVLVGYRTFDGGNGVATLDEIEFVEFARAPA